MKIYIKWSFEGLLSRMWSCLWLDLTESVLEKLIDVPMRCSYPNLNFSAILNHRPQNVALSFNRPDALRLRTWQWQSLLRKLRIYVASTGSFDNPESMQSAIFLSVIDMDALAIYNNFTFDDPADSDKLEIVIEKFRDYCTPRKNVVFERYVFWQLSKQPDGPIDSFVARLRKQSSSCEFGNQRDSVIREKNVLGCSDRNLLEIFLRENDLT